MIDLATLPAPTVVEALDFEAIYAALRADFQACIGAGWTVGDLESDPVVAVLQACAYRELLLRQRINEAARANLLAFAEGADLDQLAAFYGVARLFGENDERLRQRVQLRIAALAGGGSREYYRAIALGAHLDVIDAAVLQPTAGTVDLALWIAAEAYVPAVLAAVRLAINADAARIVGVPVTVRQAIARPVSITATIWREASAPVDLAAQLAARLPAALAAHAQLGRDLARSWLLAQLHVAGVSRVDLAMPVADLTVASDEFATLTGGTINILDGGVAW